MYVVVVKSVVSGHRQEDLHISKNFQSVPPMHYNYNYICRGIFTYIELHVAVVYVLYCRFEAPRLSFSHGGRLRKNPLPREDFYF